MASARSTIALLALLALLAVGEGLAGQAESRAQPGRLSSADSAAENQRLRRLLGLPAGPASQVGDTARYQRCPMPVAKPDTSRLAPMPSAFVPSLSTLPMRIAKPACVNPLFR